MAARAPWGSVLNLNGGGNGCMRKNNWIQAGVVGVDSGTCWIGDPCYIIHRSTPEPQLGRNWKEFCDLLDESRPTQFEYSNECPGFGVVVPTGYGDGEYPVFVKYNDEGRVVEAKVVFDDDGEED